MSYYLCDLVTSRRIDMEQMMISRGIQLTEGPVSLRPHSPDYAELVYEAVLESREALCPWMAWFHPGYTIEDTRKWLESRPVAWRQGVEYDFAVFDTRDWCFLGNLGINRIDLIDHVANIGYWIRSGRARRGIATAALRQLALFGFKELRLNRIEIVVAAGNRASQRVAEKSGATKEGLLRNRISVRERIHDAFMYSLIPGDLG